MMMKHLLWKDARALQPLVVAIVICITAINLLLWLITSGEPNSSSSEGLFVVIWILMPNLAALGAPAILVGGEEEKGTLRWLRTLPVHWSKVANAKLLVSIGAIALVWVTASLALLVARLRFSLDITGNGFTFFHLSEGSAYTDSVLSLGGLTYLMFFNLLLLLLGFVTAYSFRSPLTALLAVIPAIVLTTVAFGAASRLIVLGEILDRGFEVTPTATQSVLLVCTGIATLGGCWILQTYVAARRLSSPESDTIKNLIPAREPSAYRPPVAVIGTERPGLLRALLWQQWRQAGLPCLAITVITMIGTFGFLSSPRGFFRDVGPVIITLGACWLGSLVFYGENVLRRRVFFADRGYSPSLVWFTRLFWPGLGCLALTAIALFHQLLAEQVNAHAPAIAIGLLVNSFAMGQFVGQWRSQRPILTFFAAPVYVLLMGILPVYVLTMYSPAMRLLALAMAPVLLIASWRLTERWLTDNNGFAFTWRAAAFSMAAIALPILLAFGDRIRTTPPRNSDLRLSINEAYRDYVQAKDGDLHLGNLLAGSLAAFETHGFASEFDTVSDTEQRQRLDSELDADSIGDFVSVDDLLYLLNSPGTPAKLQESAVRVLLHWATKTREVARSGQLQLYALEQLAERGEARAVQWLFAARSSNRHDLEDLQELVRLIPDASLRQESRRNALLFEWNLYSTSEWEVKQADRTYFRKSFAGTVIGSRVGWLFFERRRADRYVDEFTKLTLAQIHRPPAVSSPEWNRRERLWEEISDLERDVRSPTVLMSTWSSDYEDQILQLRASVNGLMPHRDRRNRR